MGLKSIAKKIMGIGLPLLGAAVGGPAGGAVTNLIANALGVQSTQEKIDQALSSDPDAYLKLKKLEQDHKVELESLVLSAETAQQAEINKTMRDEAKSEHFLQWSWRPFIGYTTGLQFLAIGGALSFFILQVAMGHGFEKDAISNLSSIIQAFIPIFVMQLAVLGVGSAGRALQKWGWKPGGKSGN